MIYFIEYDKLGNIVHTCCDPAATIVPLVNRVVFNDSNGNPLKSPDGVDLSPYNSELALPLGITETIYNSIMADGANEYTCDPTTQVVSKKATS